MSRDLDYAEQYWNGEVDPIIPRKALGGKHKLFMRQHPPGLMRPQQKTFFRSGMSSWKIRIRMKSIHIWKTVTIAVNHYQAAA